MDSLPQDFSIQSPLCFLASVAVVSRFSNTPRALMHMTSDGQFLSKTSLMTNALESLLPLSTLPDDKSGTSQRSSSSSSSSPSGRRGSNRSALLLEEILEKCVRQDEERTRDLNQIHDPLVAEYLLFIGLDALDELKASEQEIERERVAFIKASVPESKNGWRDSEQRRRSSLIPGSPSLSSHARAIAPPISFIMVNSSAQKQQDTSRRTVGAAATAAQGNQAQSRRSTQSKRFEHSTVSIDLASWRLNDSLSRYWLTTQQKNVRDTFSKGMHDPIQITRSLNSTSYNEPAHTPGHSSTKGGSAPVVGVRMLCNAYSLAGCQVHVLLNQHLDGILIVTVGYAVNSQLLENTLQDIADAIRCADANPFCGFELADYEPFKDRVKACVRHIATSKPEAH